MTNVSRLLEAASQGDGVAAEELLPVVYAELRREPVWTTATPL